MSILYKTSDITRTILEALHKAKKEILLQIYYVDNDEIFDAYAQILIEKAKSGVFVYCLFDALGARTLPKSDIERKLLQAGVHIQYFNWLTPWAGNSKKLLYFRNHKRSLIIDKTSVHIGGWCIGVRTEDWIEAYMQSTDEETMHHALSDFWNMYTYAQKTQLRFRRQKKYIYSSNDDMSYTYQAPIFHGRYIYYTHRKLIHKASNRLILITPYFAPTHTFKKDIYNAQKRGLQVEIYIPKKTDSFLTDLVARTYIDTLLRLGVSVYTSDTMIHAKVGLIDDVLYVGSLNLDSVSLRYNFENGIYTKDIKMVIEAEQDIALLKKHCHRITQEEWDTRTRFEKILHICMKIFRAFV